LTGVVVKAVLELARMFPGVQFWAQEERWKKRLFGIFNEGLLTSVSSRSTLIVSFQVSWAQLLWTVHWIGGLTTVCPGFPARVTALGAQDRVKSVSTLAAIGTVSVWLVWASAVSVKEETRTKVAVMRADRN